MLSDEERREVARRLRGLNGNMRHVRRVYEAEGLSIFCEDQADYYQICDAVAGYLPAEHMHPCDYEELHERLADLIEPSCDREALLALADEMEQKADENRLTGMMSIVRARSWAEDRLDADEYESIFGEVTEGDGGKVTVSMSISEQARAKLRRESERTGESQSDIVDRLLRSL